MYSHFDPYLVALLPAGHDSADALLLLFYCSRIIPAHYPITKKIIDTTTITNEIIVVTI